MQFIAIILVIIAIVVKQIRKADPNGSGNPANRQAQQAGQRAATAYRSAASAASNRYSSSSNAGGFGRSNYRSVGSANITRDGRVYASIDFDNTHYHDEGFDFDCCISFKGLPPGTDELAVLIASNHRHERELSTLLQVRES